MESDMVAYSASLSLTRIGRHPLIWYFGLAYAFSWPFFLLSHLASGTLGIVFIVIGGFALGLPVLLAVILNLALAALGRQPDVSLLALTRARLGYEGAQIGAAQ